MALTNVDSNSFEAEVIDSELPVLVDLWAVWCGPCKRIAPLLETLATELDGQAKIVKVDVQKNQQIALKYKVSSIPTLLVFKGGKEVGRKVGAGNIDDLRKLISAHI